MRRLLALLVLLTATTACGSSDPAGSPAVPTGDAGDARDGPTSPAPELGIVGPPPAWIETEGGSFWLAYATFCWPGCADYRAPVCGDERHAPTINVRRGEVVRFHLGFEPKARLALRFFEGGKDVDEIRLPSQRMAAWKVERGGPFWIDTTDGASRSASYSGCFELENATATEASAVPDVVGLTEGEAARALDAVGLVANVRYVDDAPRQGTVFRSDPAAGSELSEHSAVVLYVSHPPRLPMPRPEQETEAGPLSRIVTRNPDVFVGLYRGRDGALHVVFGRGTDPAEWIDRLNEAAEVITYPEPGIGYRIDTCSRTYATLRPLQDEIAEDQSWHDNEDMAFGVWVDPQTCTVRVESDLLRRAEIEALIERYGTAVSFNTTEGAHPRLLPLASRD